MLAAWLALFKRCSGRLGHDWGRPPTPELTSFDNPEKYSIPSPGQRGQGSHPPTQVTHANQSLSVDEEGPTNATHPRLHSPRTPPLTPKPTRPCQPLLPHISSMSSSALYTEPQTRHLHTTTTTTTTNPSALSLHSDSPFDVQSPYTLRRPHTVAEHPFDEPDGHLYYPSRPVPEPPFRRDETLDSSTSRPSTPVSVFSSCTYGGTPDTRRSWRDSTISALGKVSTDDERDGGEGVEGEEKKGLGDGGVRHEGIFVVE